jgi:hypothetical protein
MKRSRPQAKQPRSEEVRNTILNFIRTHYYQGRFVEFAKHQRDLLRWVVFELAVYLDSKAVTIPAVRYLEIMVGEKGILMEALRFIRVEKMTYIPAYLRRCVQSHLAVHGESYYDEGKGLRNVLDIAMKFAEKQVTPEQNIARDFATAARLLKPQKRAVKTTFKAPKNQQPNLL